MMIISLLRLFVITDALIFGDPVSLSGGVANDSNGMATITTPVTNALLVNSNNSTVTSHPSLASLTVPSV